MATLKQVAEAAGVSMKTVSRVINDSPEVAEATRQRIERVIEEMNYQPNQLARSLASGKTSTIAVLIHHSVDHIFRYPFFNELLGGISTCLNENRLDLLLRFMDGKSSYTELYEQQRVDGLILANAPIDNKDTEKLIEREIPCIFLSRIALEDNPSHWVDSDFTGGAFQATEYLINLGHQHISFIAGSKHLALSHLRIRGYRQALMEHNIAVHDHLIMFQDLFMGTDKIDEMLADYWLKLSPLPTAFIASDDLAAVNLVKALQQRGFSVPDDISVVGWDNTLLSSIATPQLTSVGQQAYKKGYTAANTLLQLISNEVTASPIQINLEMELIVRDSTGPAPTQTFPTIPS